MILYVDSVVEVEKPKVDMGLVALGWTTVGGDAERRLGHDPKARHGIDRANNAVSPSVQRQKRESILANTVVTTIAYTNR